MLAVSALVACSSGTTDATQEGDNDDRNNLDGIPAGGAPDNGSPQAGSSGADSMDGLADDPPPASAEVDLDDLIPLAPNSVLVYEGGATISDTGTLHWVSPDGQSQTLAEDWSARATPTISPDRSRLFFFQGAGSEPAGVPKIIHLTPNGSTPVRQLAGNMAFANGIASESWSDDSRYIVGWGYLEGETEESVGFYDTTTETMVGSVPVTDTGALGALTGGMVLYRYDRETEKRALVSIQGDSLSAPLLLDSDELIYSPAADGSVWRATPATESIERASAFGADFESVTEALPPATSLKPLDDGSGAFVVAAGALYLLKLGAEPERLLDGLLYTSTQLLQGGLIATLEDETEFYVASDGAMTPIVRDIDWPGRRQIRDSHLLSDTTGAIGGVRDGVFGFATITPPDVTRIECWYTQETGPADKLAIPYVAGEESHLLLVDISQPAARVVQTIDATAGAKFGCAQFSLDGNFVAVPETGDAGSKLYIIDWQSAEPSEPVMILETAEAFNVFAML